MRKISDELIRDFKKEVKDTVSERAGIREILNGVLYLLWMNGAKITWWELEKKLRDLLVIKEGPMPPRPSFDVVFPLLKEREHWKAYFSYAPALLGYNLGQNSSDKRVEVFKSPDWPAFIHKIEKDTFPIIAADDRMFDAIVAIARAVSEAS